MRAPVPAPSPTANDARGVDAARARPTVLIMNPDAAAEQPAEPAVPYGPEHDPDGGHDYVDRSLIDFDPADGLFSGTAVDGTTEIPGPHADAAGDAAGDHSADTAGDAGG